MNLLLAALALAAILLLLILGGRWLEQRLDQNPGINLDDLDRPREER